MLNAHGTKSQSTKTPKQQFDCYDQAGVKAHNVTRRCTRTLRHKGKIAKALEPGQHFERQL